MCVPMAGAVMVAVAVEDGDEAVTGTVATLLPSRVMETVPVGAVALAEGGLMVTVSCRLLPASGVKVAGVKTTVGAELASVTTAAADVELV